MRAPSKEMRFFHLKLGNGNELASVWLDEANNPLGKPAAVIFFGRCTIEDLKSGKCDSQASDFYKCSLPDNRKNTIMVVVGQGKVWFLRPAGSIESHDPSTPEQESEHIWKMMPGEIICTKAAKDVPPVLAGINANAWLSRGTFRELRNWGNVKAVCASAGIPIPSEQLQASNCNPSQLLECLSSVELETLVAKLFESADCFVPAYRGGCIRDIDLFVHNDGDKEVALGALRIRPKSRVSVQVKGWTDLKKCPAEVDYLIGLDLPVSDKCFDGDWLLRQVRQKQRVKDWLMRSMNWLPPVFLSRYSQYGLYK